MTIATVVRAHLRTGADGSVEFDDAGFAPLAGVLSSMTNFDAAVELLDVIGALGPSRAALQLGGVITLLAQRLNRADAEKLRARASMFPGAVLPSVKAAPTAGSRPFTASLLAELRSSKK